MARKENDWFVESINNPGFTNTDFKQVGINIDNTSMASKDVYKNNAYIQLLFQTDGLFDEAKFDKAYMQALYTYNQLAVDTYQEDMTKTYVASRNNVFVKPEMRAKEGSSMNISFGLNPLEDTKGIHKLGFKEEGPLTVEEIALELKVFDPATGKWSDSPNDSFFSNFFNTLVLAQWEFDADVNGNPTNNLDEVVYELGQYKLNELGKPYYEYLNGRSTVGKTILHKSDIITDDRSAMNAIDFFDSDGKEKSTWGVVMKNLVSIAPMLIPHTAIPYIASVYIGTGVILNFGKLLTTASKVIGGSNIDLVNNTEGFLDSLTLSETKSNTKSQWSLANMIDLGGMVFKLLAEQRWLFKYGPALLLGTMWDDAALEAYKAKKLKSLDDALDSKVQSMVKDKNSDWFKFFSEGKVANQRKAQKALDDVNKYYLKIGEELSRIYMTGIVVADSYNEAKALGLSDGEAAVYTLAYALGEYGVLKTDIGKWVLPELKLAAHKNRKIIQTISKDIKKSTELLVKKSEQSIADHVELLGSKFLRLFKLGLEKSKVDSRLGAAVGKFAFANALAEGTEEVSEELLADVSKLLFNVANALRGDDSRMNPWENMFDRYAMSFVGGILGGGLFSITPDLRKAYKAVGEMTKTTAIAEIASMSLNGELEPLLKQIESTKFASEHLSILEAGRNGDTVIYNPANGEINQDEAIKTLLVRQIKIIDDVINKHNVKFNNDTVLDAAILSDVKYSKLLKSSLSSRYLDDFTAAVTKLVELEVLLQDLANVENNTLENLLTGNKDSNKLDSVAKDIQEKAKKERQKTIEAKIKELKSIVESFVNGDRSNDYILDSMFEIEQTLSSPYIAGTLSVFAKLETGKDISLLNDQEILDVRESFKKYREAKFADNVRTARNMFDSVMATLAPHITPEFLKSLKPKSNKVSLILEAVVESLKTKEGKVNGRSLLVPLLTIEEIGESLKDSVKNLKIAIVREFLSEQLNKELDNIKKLEKELTEIAQELDTAQAEFVKLGEDILNEEEGSDKRNELIKERQEKGKKVNSLLDKLNAKKLETTSKYEDLENNDINFLFENSLEKLFNGLRNTPISTLSKKLLVGAILSLDPTAINPNIGEYLGKAERLSTSSAHVITEQLGLVLGKQINIPTLISLIENLLIEASQDISTFSLSDILQKAMDEALNMVELLKSALYGFRYDASLTNIFGYSATKNLLENSNLPEIQSVEIDPIINLLNELINLLQYYQNINLLNLGLKMKIQERASLNLTKLIYKKISDRLIIAIPDDWAGKKEFIQTIESTNALKSIILLNRLDLNAEEALIIEQEKAKIELAIHKLFNDNIDKLDSLDIMSSIFSISNFNGFLQTNNRPIDDKSTDIDDLSFYWYLCTLTAINPNDFYFNYKEVVGNDKIAPIASLEMLTMVGLASLINPEIFLKFTNILKNTVTTLEPSGDNYDSTNYSSKYKKGSAFYPRFGDVVFIEGVPGSGKSSVVMNNIIRMLGSDSPLFENVLNIHSSSDNAEKSSELWGIKAMHNYDRLQALSYMSSDHLDKFNTKGDVLQFKNKADLTIDEDGDFSINSSINEVSPKPSMVIIDEVSLWSTADLIVAHEFCKKHNIPLVVLGDLLLTTLLGKELIDKDTTYESELSRGFFAHGPKLGVSMRVNNTQLIANELIMREASITGEYPISPNRLHWALEGNELYGMKVIDYISPDNVPDYVKLDIKNQLLSMVDSLGENDVIGYIYEKDSNNIIEYLLTLPEFSEIAKHINKQEGTTSQGLEAKYYIIEVYPENSSQIGHIKKLYTGITRASLGGLIFNKNDILLPNSDTPDPSVQIISPLTPEIIQQYASKRFDVLDKVYPKGNPLAAVNGPANSEEDILVTLEEEIAEKRLTVLLLKAKDTQVFPQMIYSFNTTHLVGLLDLIGYGVDQRTIKFRIDSLLGIERLLSSRTRPEHVDVFYKLKSIFKYSNDLNDLKNKVAAVLEIDFDKIEIDMALKSSVVSKNGSAYRGLERFHIHPEEGLSNIFNYEHGVKKVPFKRIVGIININGKPSIEIPLYTINNWKQVLESEEFADLEHEYKNFKASKDSKNNVGDLLIGGEESEAFGKYILSKLNTITDQKTKTRWENYANLCKLYKFTSNGIFYFDADNFIKTLVTTGPTLIYKDITNAANYATYINTILEIGDFTGTKLYVTSKPMVVTNKTSIDLGDELLVIEAGKPFVLVSDDTTINQSDLIDTFLNKQKLSKQKLVQLFYLVNPSIGVEEYFLYIADGISDSRKENSKRHLDNLDKNIGTEFTDFYIIQNFLDSLSVDQLKDNGWLLLKKHLDELYKLFDDIDKSNYSSKDKASKKRELLKLNVYEVDPTLKTGSSTSQTIKYRCRVIINGLLNFKGLDGLEKLLYEKLVNETNVLFPSGVFYNPDIKTSDVGNNIPFKYINTSGGDYSIDVLGKNRPFMINGKIDTTVVFGDLSNLLGLYTTKVTTNTTNGMLSSKDNDIYLEIKPKNPGPNGNDDVFDYKQYIKDNVPIHIQKDPEFIKSIDAKIIDDKSWIPYILNDLGFIAFEINGKLICSTARIPGLSNLFYSIEYNTLTIEINDKKYVANLPEQIDGNNISELEFIEKQDVSENQQPTFDQNLYNEIKDNLENQEVDGWLSRNLKSGSKLEYIIKNFSNLDEAINTILQTNKGTIVAQLKALGKKSEDNENLTSLISNMIKFIKSLSPLEQPKLCSMTIKFI